MDTYSCRSGMLHVENGMQGGGDRQEGLTAAESVFRFKGRQIAVAFMQQLDAKKHKIFCGSALAL